MKDIIFGSGNGGIGDLLMVNPLMRQNPNNVMQFYPNKRGISLSQLFMGICRIEFTDRMLSEPESKSLFGDISKHSPFENSALNFINIFGGDPSDIIPRIPIYQFDLDFAEEYLKRYENPICINAIVRDWQNLDNYQSLYKMLPFKEWQKIVDFLIEKGYTPVQFGTIDGVCPIEKVKFDIGLSLREMMACIHKIGRIITLDSGQHNLGIAAGAKVICLRPYNNSALGYFGSNWHFDRDEYWINKERNVKYYYFDEIEKFISEYDI